MNEPVSEFTVSIEQVADYEFRVNFDGSPLAPLTVDEGPPLGKSAGPSPARLLAAAVGSCLNASLLFCARKVKIDLGHLRSRVRVQTVRNEQRRLRIGKIEVSIAPELGEGERERVGRCLELFEDYCTVTQSVRSGIPVEVRVEGLDGETSSS
jgi:uncharacterized OsmC-like protein